MNYTQLKQNIQDWAEDDGTEFVAELDTIIALAEKRIYRDVDLPVTRKYSTSLTFVAGTDTLDMPSDFVVSRWIAITDGDDKNFLLKKDVSFIRDFWPSISARGKPRYYADYDYNTIIVAPRPDQAYAVELSYQYYPTSIVSASTTWLGDNADNLLLYACMVEASLFQKQGDDIIKRWMELYKNALDRVIEEHAGVRRRTDEFRGGESRG